MIAQVEGSQWATAGLGKAMLFPALTTRCGSIMKTRRSQSRRAGAQRRIKCGTTGCLALQGLGPNSNRTQDFGRSSLRPGLPYLAPVGPVEIKEFSKTAVANLWVRPGLVSALRRHASNSAAFSSSPGGCCAISRASASRRVRCAGRGRRRRRCSPCRTDWRPARLVRIRRRVSLKSARIASSVRGLVWVRLRSPIRLSISAKCFWAAARAWAHFGQFRVFQGLHGGWLCQVGQQGLQLRGVSRVDEILKPNGTAIKDVLDHPGGLPDRLAIRIIQGDAGRLDTSALCVDPGADRPDGGVRRRDRGQGGQSSRPTQG